MQSGYKTITPIKLINGVHAYNNQAIGFKALRVYLSCFELEAIREAAKRSRKDKTNRGELRVRFQKIELVALTGGLSLRSISKSLKELEAAGLMKFEEGQIIFTDTPQKNTRDLIELACSGRKGTRGIPVPRRLIRFLAKSNKPALFLTLIGHLLRGLSIDRRTGKANPRGTVKASWISQVFEISLRAAKSARAELISLGIISKDVNSYQRKLNRDGAYFELNLDWSKPIGRGESQAKTVDNFATSKTEFAPPIPQNCTEFAPPIKILKTSKEYKNQKTQRTEPSGFCKQKNTEKKPPTIWNIQPEDFREFSRNEELYWQARSRGLISGSEADILNWIAASVRAKETQNPGAVFMGIIKKKLFHHITQAQEEYARKALHRRREKYFEAYREQSKERLVA